MTDKKQQRRSPRGGTQHDAANEEQTPLADLLTPEQCERLLAAKAWWQEGEFALDFLAERAGHEARIGQIRLLLGDLRAEGGQTPAETLAPLLRLVRGLSANRALNRNLLTPTFPGALRDLLFGTDGLPERLTRFLESQRLVGAQTASQFLYAAFPDRFALVSPATLAMLAPTREQRVRAREIAQARFDASPHTPAPVLALLGDLVLYEAAREMLGVDSFVDVNAVLWHAAARRGADNDSVTRKPAFAAAAPLRPVLAREPAAVYATARVAPPQTDGDDDAEENGDDTSAGEERDLLDLVEAHVAAQGFTYPALAVRNYYVALKTKPFVILAGLSGTGKTRLTELFAEAICDNAAPGNGQYLLLPVRPDWTDPSALLGYHNLLAGEYVSTPFLDLLREAARPANAGRRAFFVCLDEMNLARVEHYFADVLSAMETRARTLLLPGGPADAAPATLAPNVFLTGSVNVDEAAYPFSKKVLDRANTLEFSEVRLRRNENASSASERAAPPDLPFGVRQRLFLRSRVANVSVAREKLDRAVAGFADRAENVLADLNERLEARGLHFGYRVRDEVLRYLANSLDAAGRGLLLPSESVGANLSAAFDIQIVGKVLPRVAGTHEALSGLLTSLDDWASAEGFVRTQAKLARMRARAADEGVVSFYEG